MMTVLYFSVVLLFSTVLAVIHSLSSFISWSRTPFRVDYPFQNSSLPWDERVNDLVSRLTLEEIQRCSSAKEEGGRGEVRPPLSPASGSDRTNGGPTVAWGDVAALATQLLFLRPSASLLHSGCPDLSYRIAVATANEVRAKHNYFISHDIYSGRTGLSCFSPDVDVLRDPRWGRNQETHGEDPYMSGVQSQAYVRGLQGDHPRYVRVSAGCKHYAVYAGPENYPMSRFDFDPQVSMRDLRMTFLPQFKMCIDAGSYSVMSSYNAFNGTPVCANKFLLTEVLRNEWNFTGYVLADAGAIENVINTYHYLNNSVDTVAACVNAGCNIEVSLGAKVPVYMSLVQAIKQGKLEENFVRESLKPLFYTRMRLGEFDPPEMNPYTKLSQDEIVESADHQALAVEAAMKSFVLLKNDGVLPVTKLYDDIGVVGPMANNTEQLFGDYTANTDPSYATSPLDGLRKVARSVQFASGCDDNVCKHYDAVAVKRAVTGTQINFVVLGTGQAVEAEGLDRRDIELSGHQKQILLDVMLTAPNTPLVLLLYSGSAVNITEFADDPRVRAIVQGFLPAQAAGTALTHLLLNDLPGAVPAGRLPYTWPALASQIPSMVNYSMAGRTYRYFQGDPLYPFGYGLSYVTFTYLGMEYDNHVQAGHNLTGAVYLQNNGDIEADEVVQVYISWTDKSLPAPKLQLVWFDRVTIRTHFNVRVNFTVDARQMALWFDDGWEVRAGDMMVYVGGQQPNQKRQVPSNVLNGRFTIQGSQYLGVY